VFLSETAGSLFIVRQSDGVAGQVGMQMDGLIVEGLDESCRHDFVCERQALKVVDMPSMKK